MVKIILNLFVFLLFAFAQVYAQSERDQKIAIRQNPNSPSQSQQRNGNWELERKSEIRREESRPHNPILGNPMPPMWRGWNRWGAPLNYWYYDDIFLPGRWGYQAPARVYFYEGRKPDTIRSKKSKVRIGLTVGTWDELGGWMTIGREIYFKVQMTGKVSTDKSLFYTNPQVNFYNASTVWKDERLQDVEKGWNLYLGVGREFKNFGINASLGIGREEENFQFFDEYYQLSSNGRYSFRNFADEYVTLSLGMTSDFKFLSMSAEFDPIRKTFYLGTGFNF